MTQSSSPPEWFDQAIANGLQRLYALSLPRTPSADLLFGTASAWVDALWSTRAWEQARDVPRLNAAFLRLSGVAEQWPAPVMLLRYLPEVPASRPALGRTWTTDEILANRRRLRDVLRDAIRDMPDLPYQRGRRDE
ncbi:hypothetical protein [Alloalcanivorax xenomutans]|uniref:hypothetical protein n=1 Tax=Alloalcanivorax xenomutans TaxID=1094342 RepID=UPI003C5EC049